MSREAFFAWLATCPGGIWDITNDDFGVTSITFLYEEEAGEEDLVQDVLNAHHDIYCDWLDFKDTGEKEK